MNHFGLSRFRTPSISLFCFLTASSLGLVNSKADIEFQVRIEFIGLDSSVVAETARIYNEQIQNLAIQDGLDSEAEQNGNVLLWTFTGPDGSCDTLDRALWERSENIPGFFEYRQEVVYCKEIGGSDSGGSDNPPTTSTPPVETVPPPAEGASGSGNTGVIIGKRNEAVDRIEKDEMVYEYLIRFSEGKVNGQPFDANKHFDTNPVSGGPVYDPFQGFRTTPSRETVQKRYTILNQNSVRVVVGPIPGDCSSLPGFLSTQVDNPGDLPDETYSLLFCSDSSGNSLSGSAVSSLASQLPSKAVQPESNSTWNGQWCGIRQAKSCGLFFGPNGEPYVIGSSSSSGSNPKFRRWTGSGWQEATVEIDFEATISARVEARVILDTSGSDSPGEVLDAASGPGGSTYAVLRDPKNDELSVGVRSSSGSWDTTPLNDTYGGDASISVDDDGTAHAAYIDGTGNVTYASQDSSLTPAGAKAQEITELFPRAKYTEDEWWYSNWLGFFNGRFNPWIYNTELGWLFAIESKGNYFFSPTFGWMYTTPDQFSDFYSFKERTWMFWTGLSATEGEESFFNYTTSEFTNLNQ